MTEHGGNHTKKAFLYYKTSQEMEHFSLVFIQCLIQSAYRWTGQGQMRTEHRLLTPAGDSKDSGKSSDFWIIF